MVKILLILFVSSFVIGIPFWIRLIYFKPYQSKVKKIVMIFMLIVATGFAIFMVYDAATSQNEVELWFSPITMTIYLSASYISAYYSWPRKNKPLTSDIDDNSKKETEKGKSTMQEKNLVVIPVISGTYEEVTTSLIKATFIVENERLKKFPYSDFGAWLMEEIHNNQKIFALKRGLFNKKYFCPSCNTELDLETISSKRIEFECNDKKIPQFTMQITMPSVVCPKCNKTCAVDQKGILDYQLGEALIKAFNSENIKR